MDWDYRKYLKEIVCIGILFGIVFSLIQGYLGDNFNADITKDMFRAIVFGAFYQYISFIYAFVVTFIHITINFERKIIDHKVSLIKYAILAGAYIILVSILFFVIKLTWIDILNCVLRFLFISTLNYFVISYIYYLKNRKKY